VHAQVEQIMLAPREAYSVSSMLALREVSELKPSMPKAQAEVVLASLVVRGWLLRSKCALPCRLPPVRCLTRRPQTRPLLALRAHAPRAAVVPAR
jgi:hypothetical protein